MTTPQSQKASASSELPFASVALTHAGDIAFFLICNNVGFMVSDSSHHVGCQKRGTRSCRQYFITQSWRAVTFIFYILGVANLISDDKMIAALTTSKVMQTDELLVNARFQPERALFCCEGVQAWVRIPGRVRTRPLVEALAGNTLHFADLLCSLQQGKPQSGQLQNN